MPAPAFVSRRASRRGRSRPRLARKARILDERFRPPGPLERAVALATSHSRIVAAAGRRAHGSHARHRAAGRAGQRALAFPLSERENSPRGRELR